jgi:hypothetical protein
MNVTDSLTAAGTAAITGTITTNVEHFQGYNPIVTQILVPLVAAIIVPFLKDLSKVYITFLKDKLKRKKPSK